MSISLAPQSVHSSDVTWTRCAVGGSRIIIVQLLQQIFHFPVLRGTNAIDPLQVRSMQSQT
jgi:hypothetical protein